MFGFIDPAAVIRSTHLIPSFCYDRAAKPTVSSLACDDPLLGDWNFYYVNRFVDRDMAVRYMPGVGIGHLNVSQNTNPDVAETMFGDNDEPESDMPHTNDIQEGLSGSDLEHNDSDDGSHVSYDSMSEEDQD
ncbi:hypothetical protein FRC06_007450, partial [Ceratobasidium sp. 370]